MLREIKSKGEHYFLDDLARYQGEYKVFWDNGQLWQHYFYRNNKKHGEYKAWDNGGELYSHCFYTNGIFTNFYEIPEPPSQKTEEDRLFYLLKYNMPLLPVESV